MKAATEISKFTDYRTFLLAHVQDIKAKKKNWSLGAWANSMGFQAKI